MSLAAVILAAGASSRMGRPKALLPFRGETILDRLIGLYARIADPVVVVLGHHEAAIRAGIARGGAAVLSVNPEPARGQLSSLQCGLSLVPAAADTLFTPVDYPAVESETLGLLARAFAARPAVPMLAPSCGGRHGHPVFIRASLKDELLGLPPGATARQVLDRYRTQAVYVDVNDPGVVADLDTPEDYERMLAGEAPCA